VTHEPPASPGASPHLDLDRIAELDEGLLASNEASAADAHIAGCPVCRQRSADLRATRALLSALPSDQMPESVAARIDAALAAAGGPTTVVPLHAKRRGWRAHPTAAGLGAAAAVAALVAALVVGRTSSHPASDQAGQPAGAGGALANRSQLTLPPSATTGTRYSPKNLDRTVPQLLAPQSAAVLAAPQGATPTPATEAGTADSSIPSALSRLFSSPGALDACVRGVASTGTGPPLTPLAIDFARDGGAPAVLIVLPGLEDGKVDAWFVGPNCVTANPQVLFYKAVPAPSSASPSP
jgi:hypothetical protein